MVLKKTMWKRHGCGSGTVTFATLVMALFFVAQAKALPVCEDESGSPVCRKDIEAEVTSLRDSLKTTVKSERDSRSPVNSLNKALTEFTRARTDRDDSTLPDADRCVQASKHDERALKEAARAVRDAVRLGPDKFTDGGTGATAEMTTLVDAMIGGVRNDVDEVKTLIGTTNGSTEAADSRLAQADSTSDLGRAADKAQSAYDVVDDDGNLDGQGTGTDGFADCLGNGTSPIVPR